MRIALYSSSITRSAGGIFSAMVGLSRALSSAGHEVHIIGGADEHFEVDQVVWGSATLHPHSFVGGYGFNIRAYPLIRKVSPDVLHIHGIWSATSIHGLIGARSGRPVILSPHGMLDRWILARRPQIKRIHSALFEKPLMRRAQLHALTENERHAIQEFLPAAANRIFVVPNGITSCDATEGMAVRNGALFLGRLHPKKQTLELIEAWRKCSALQGLELTIAGWGEEPYEKRVIQATHETRNVRFVGALFGQQKEAAFRGARFFVLPSLSEGLPMAVLEALHYGAIPLITDHCNLPELIESDVAVRISADLSDLSEVMAKLISLGATQLDAIADRGRTIAKRYRWDAIADQMTFEYEGALESR